MSATDYRKHLFPFFYLAGKEAYQLLITVFAGSTRNFVQAYITLFVEDI